MNFVTRRCQTSTFVILLVLMLSSLSPFAATFRLVGPMNQLRTSHTATLLTNGTVLLAGGGSATAEVFDPSAETFSPVGSLSTNRSRHTATLLPNGQVLVAGGSADSESLVTAELYNPVTKAFSAAGHMRAPRADHTATRLQDGTVLITGGYAGAMQDTAEIYDPSTDTFTFTTGRMTGVRGAHVATLLNDGSVLITGGFHPSSSGGGGRSEAETYDPLTRTFTATANHMIGSRNIHNATLLENGQVLLTGGFAGFGQAFDSAELYDPVSRTFAATGDLNIARLRETSTRLTDGTVLIAGGNYLDGQSAELYHPTSASFTISAALNQARAGHRATLLQNGRVLITGGAANSSAEIYEPDLPVTVPARAVGGWHWRNPWPQGDLLRAVAYGQDTFVAVGERGVILNSPDGSYWSVVATVTNNLFDVIFEQGLFVAVGGDFTSTTSLSSDMYTSTDGANWTRREAHGRHPFMSVAYGSDKFVAVSFRGSVATSSDALTWTTVESGPLLNSLVFADGLFVGVGDAGTISTSGDGLSWSNRNSTTSENLNHVVVGAGLFAAVGAHGTVVTSPDGASWTSRSSGTSRDLHSLAFQDNVFVSAGDGGTILTSTSGLAWTSRDAGESVDLFAVGFGQGQFVALGRSGAILGSADGQSWTRHFSASTLNDLNAVAYGSGTFVAVGQGGTVIQSPTGMDWSLGNSGVTNELLAITYAQGKFIAVGVAGIILTSSNAIDWQARNSGSAADWQGVAYGNETFVAVGLGGQVVTSPTGDVWIPHNSGTPSDLWSVAFGHGVFAASGGRSGYFLASSNGVSWTQGDFIQPIGYYGIAFGADTFLAVGDSSLHNPFFILAQSRDGLSYDFTQAFEEGTGQDELTAVTFGAGTFVAVGRNGTVIASGDEHFFYYSDSGTRVALRGVAFGNNTFVAVGAGGAILQTDPLAILTLQAALPSQLKLSGAPGRSYSIQAADRPDSGAAWTTVTNLLLSTDSLTWNDPAPFQSHRYYRARLARSLIVNGGFESPGYAAAPDYRYLADESSPSAKLGALPGWTVSNDQVGEPPYLARLSGYPAEVRAGQYGLVLNQGSGIATTFPIGQGQTYRLSLWIRPADDVDNITPDPLAVRIAGLNTAFAPSPGWSYRTFQFRAATTDPAARLEISNDSPVGDWRAWDLDEVTVELIP